MDDLETPADIPRDPEDDAPEEVVMMSAAEYAEFAVCERGKQERLWLGACRAFVDAACKPNRPEVHPRVAHAINDATIAACERAARILRSDLPPPDYEPVPFDDED